MAPLLVALLALLALLGCRTPGPAMPADSSGDLTGRFPAEWQGDAIGYSGYREGQSPQAGVLPTQDQVVEDLRLLARHWSLIRVYASDRHGEDVLEAIRREQLDLDVMLGIWLAREPGKEDVNAAEVAAGIRLANEYEDIVVAVNVGNETLIEWTAHPVPEERVIGYVRQVKAGIDQPVTVADNYVWWRDFGAALAEEVDFITMHSYPIWERRGIDQGLSYTIENFEEVRQAFPDKPIVIGEAGWASYTEGNQHLPRAGDERKQKRYFEELTGWARENGVTVFFFEAFDEPWKGTGTEGHWGLFTVDREAKPAVQHHFPDRMPEGPTSPSYPESVGAVGPDLAVALRRELADAIVGGSVNPMGQGVSSSEVVSSDQAEGGTALKLVLNGESWGGVYFYIRPYDAREFDAIAMRVRLPDDVAALELKLEGPETNAQSVNLLDYPTGAGREVDGWRTYLVPLSVFDRIDRSQLAIVGLWNPANSAGTFVPAELILDDIRFE